MGISFIQKKTVNNKETRAKGKGKGWFVKSGNLIQSQSHKGQ
jgi:hypothetical protein